MGFIMGTGKHARTERPLKRAFIPGFSPVHLAVNFSKRPKSSLQWL